MDIPWDDVRLFLAVAETGSLSAAARLLRVGQPTMSRRLAQLEAMLGEALFRRSVQGVALTGAGERLLEPARKMAEWAGEIGRAAQKSDPAPHGVVRVAAPPGVAFLLLAPFAAWLRQRYPELRLEVLSAIHYLDLARGEADLALRLRAPAQRDLVCVASLEHENAAYAAPSYVERLPRKYGIADIDWIAWAPPFDGLPPNPQLEAAIPGFRPAFSSDNFLVQLRAAEMGLGAMFLGRARHRVAPPPALEELHLDLGQHAQSSLHLVCARSALDVPRVRAVAELLAEELAHTRAPGASRAAARGSAAARKRPRRSAT
jgi:DNA-binding transcriptional LysR family regulator